MKKETGRRKALVALDDWIWDAIDVQKNRLGILTRTSLIRVALIDYLVRNIEGCKEKVNPQKQSKKPR